VSKHRHNRPDDVPEGDLAPGAATYDVVHHQAYRKKRPLRPSKMEVNLTSMIDIVFQLLIYFVVTTSFAVGEGVLTAKLPTGTGNAKQVSKPPMRPLNIIIRSAGAAGTGYSVEVEGLASRLRSFTDLSEVLTQLQYDPVRGLNGAYKPSNPLIIRPSSIVRWQHVVNAFNAAVKAQYTNVSFAQANSQG